MYTYTLSLCAPDTFDILLVDLLIGSLSDAGNVHILTNPMDDEHHMADGRQPVLARGWLLVAPNKL